MKEETICQSLACIEEHEGVEISVIGTFVSAKESEAFSVNKIVMADGNTIILNTGSKFCLVPDSLNTKSDGRRMKLTGIVYKKTIPDKYKIFGRTQEPYMVEIVSAEIVPL